MSLDQTTGAQYSLQCGLDPPQAPSRLLASKRLGLLEGPESRPDQERWE
jgi:hypothetical protein